MPRIPEEIIERIKEATDIVEIVSEHVQLTKRGGTNFFGPCPFHKENTPSFSVNVDRQIYHCFGCGVGGNVFKFLQEIDHISFVEAVHFLAQRSGISLPEQSRSPEQEDVSDQLYRANDLAQKYFHHLLCSDAQGAQALDYLHARQITDETIEHFGLGYAPNAWDGLLKVAGRRGLPPPILERAGLVLPRQSGGGYYDRFRDRVTFSIANLSSRTIAFGARALQPDQEPKYLNSPETPVYRKSAVLYGLNRTQKAIRQEEVALVVEGYMDQISLFQRGIPNVVASAGTALTEEQCRLLARSAPRVVLIFDGDAAGSTAAMRGIEVLLSTGLDAGVVSLPPEHDPDSFVQAEGADAFRTLIADAQTVLAFYLQQLALQHDLGTMQGKAQALEAFKPLLLRSSDPVRRDLLLREVALHLGIDEQAVRQELHQESRRSRPRERAPEPDSTPAQPPPTREKEFLGLLLNYPQFISPTAQQLAPEAFIDPRSQALARILFARATDNRLDISLLMSSVEDPAVAQLISTCAVQGFTESQVDRHWQENILYFQIEEVKRRVNNKRQELQAAVESGKEEEAMRITAELVQLDKERRALQAEQNP
jgi:DNA primase